MAWAPPINTLTLFDITGEPAVEGQEPPDCPICSERLYNPELFPSEISTCHHRFHRECLFSWCNNNAGNTLAACRCPTCQKIFNFNTQLQNLTQQVDARLEELRQQAVVEDPAHYDYIKCLWIGNSDKSFLLLVNKNGTVPGNKIFKKGMDAVPLYTKDGENYFQTTIVKEAEEKAERENDSFVLDTSDYAKGFAYYLFSNNVSDIFIRMFRGIPPNVYNPPDDSMIFYDRIPRDSIEPQPPLDTRKFGDILNTRNNSYLMVISGDGVFSPFVDCNRAQVGPDDYLVVSKKTADANKLFIGKSKNYTTSDGTLKWNASPEEYVNQAEKMVQAGFTKPPEFPIREYNIYVERPKDSSCSIMGGKKRKKTLNKRRTTLKRCKKSRKTKRRRQ
jgi:hypothetical protein